MATTQLSYVKSKKQLKWNGSKDDVKTFLASQLNTDSMNVRVNDIGSCTVFKHDQITCNFYTRAKTLQVQGKDEAEVLKLRFIDLATNNELEQTIDEEGSLNGDSRQNPDQVSLDEEASIQRIDVDSQDATNTNHSDCPYFSYFNDQISTILSELKGIKEKEHPGNPSSSSVAMSKLQEENDDLKQIPMATN